MKTKKRKISDIVAEGLLDIISYYFILIIFDLIFIHMYIDNDHYSLWVLITACVLVALNKTIRPVLVYFALPITGLTVGIFYFVINTIILKLCDFLLLEYFNLTGILMPFVITLLILFVHLMLERFFIDPIMRFKKGRSKKNE